MNPQLICRNAALAMLIPTFASIGTSGVLAQPVSPFVGSSAGVWEDRGIVVVVPETLQSSAVGPVITEANNQPMAYAQFRGGYGSNAFTIQVQSNVNREADGASFWTDGFTVTGGAGVGFLTLSTHITGTVSGLGEMNYGLFVSSQPFDLTTLLSTARSNHSGFWALSLPNSTRMMFSGVSNGCGVRNWSRECGHVPFENYQGALDLTLSATVPYTNGQPLYMLSLFAGGVGGSGGVESFLNSADFGVTPPLGATVQSLSTTVYAQAVPEPSPTFLILVGLLLGVIKLHRPSDSRARRSHTAA